MKGENVRILRAHIERPAGGAETVFVLYRFLSFSSVFFSPSAYRRRCLGNHSARCLCRPSHPKSASRERSTEKVRVLPILILSVKLIYASASRAALCKRFRVYGRTCTFSSPFRGHSRVPSFRSFQDILSRGALPVPFRKAIAMQADLCARTPSSVEESVARVFFARVHSPESLTTDNGRRLHCYKRPAQSEEVRDRRVPTLLPGLYLFSFFLCAPFATSGSLTNGPRWLELPWSGCLRGASV